MVNDIIRKRGKYEDFWIYWKNKNIVRWISIILILVPIVFQLFLSSLPLYQRFAFILYSVIFLLLGYGGIYFVLGIQIILKIAPKKILKVACNFFIICCIIISISNNPNNYKLYKYRWWSNYNCIYIYCFWSNYRFLQN